MAPYLDSDLDTIHDFDHDAPIQNLKPGKQSIDVDTKVPGPPSKLLLLQASPYTTPEHFLDLSTLTLPLQLFAKSLVHMQAVRSDYATAPYSEAFNWQSIVDAYSSIADDDRIESMLQPLHFFVIVFRSRINPDADRTLLGQLDSVAHVEAVDGGGLLKYWFGTPDENGRNLATCAFGPKIYTSSDGLTQISGIWRNREDARRGGGGPGHIAAIMAARRMYNEWFVERLKLSIDLRTRSWSFSEWKDAPEGST